MPNPDAEDSNVIKGDTQQTQRHTNRHEEFPVKWNRVAHKHKIP
jgi:hypothetical protein